MTATVRPLFGPGRARAVVECPHGCRPIPVSGPDAATVARRAGIRARRHDAGYHPA